MTHAEYQAFQATDPFERMAPAKALEACRILVAYHERQVLKWGAGSNPDPRWQRRDEAEVRRHERLRAHFQKSAEEFEGRIANV